jgi:ribonuclease BN (tRNA processing enzyme)
MISVYVPDVGDGLAAGVWTIDDKRIQIDCGSQQRQDEAFMKGLNCIFPDVFVLSHFHFDHYNGLLQSPRGAPFQTIRQVLFPLMPKFPQRTEFMSCLMAMNHWVMGDTTGSLEADFLGILSKINYHPFTYKALSLGDTVQIRSSRFEVLWPPRILEDGDTLSLIRTAITDFENAAKEDESLRRIREKIGESGEIQPYLGTDEGGGERSGCGDRDDREMDFQPFLHEQREIPKSVSKANDSLRHAANHLSLAFHQDNRFLFLGDLEKHEIVKVVDYLLKEDIDHFVVMISPHHGTHWHKSLDRLHSRWVISSVGEGLFNHVAPGFKSMGDCHLITHWNGDIEVPLHFAPHYAPRF